MCKKYAPHAEQFLCELFENFVREIKLLHRVHHENVVRVFNHYLYPESFTGYILMEFVDGKEIDEYIAEKPDEINEVFTQVVSGFTYLEAVGILHRDIRPKNIMVAGDGTAKIIDLGFGKEVRSSADFEKSISLNWWCEPPEEFADATYNFATEVYFVGKLFERLIEDNGIAHFKYREVLRRMCDRNPAARTASFSAVLQGARNDLFFEIEFEPHELSAYREFADAILPHYTRIENGAKYVTDTSKIQSQLGEVYKKFMLEEYVPNAALVLRCFVTGNYYYRQTGLEVDTVREFVQLLKSATEEKRRIVIANLHCRLDNVTRYDENRAPPSDDIPF